MAARRSRRNRGQRPMQGTVQPESIGDPGQIVPHPRRRHALGGGPQRFDVGGAGPQVGPQQSQQDQRLSIGARLCPRHGSAEHRDRRDRPGNRSQDRERRGDQPTGNRTDRESSAVDQQKYRRRHRDTGFVKLDGKAAEAPLAPALCGRRGRPADRRQPQHHGHDACRGAPGGNDGEIHSATPCSRSLACTFGPGW